MKSSMLSLVSCTMLSLASAASLKDLGLDPNVSNMMSQGSQSSGNANQGNSTPPPGNRVDAGKFFFQQQPPPPPQFQGQGQVPPPPYNMPPPPPPMTCQHGFFNHVRLSIYMYLQSRTYFSWPLWW